MGICDTYSVEFNRGQGWTPIKAYTDNLKRNIQWFNSSLKPCLSSVKINLEYNSVLWNHLLQNTWEVNVRIFKNGNIWFEGVIPADQFKANIKQNQRILPVTIYDITWKVKDGFNSDINFYNYKVCDPLNPGSSIIHSLVQKCGIPLEKIFITQTIDKVVSNFEMSCEDSDPYKEIEKLLFEFGYIMYGHIDGCIKLFSFDYRNATPGLTLKDGDVEIGDLKINTKTPKYSGVSVTYWEKEFIENALIYRENIDPESVGIAILPLSAWPVVSEGEKFVGEYTTDFIDGENVKFDDVINPVLTCNLDDPDLPITVNFSLNKKDFTGYIWNRISATTYYLTTFDIRADVYVRSQRCDITPDSIYSKKVKTEYIENKEEGIYLTDILNLALRFCDSSVTFSSKFDLVNGQCYKLVSADHYISTDIIIIKKEDKFSKIKRYVGMPLDKIHGFTYTVNKKNKKTAPANLAQQAVFKNLEERPTFNQLDQGYEGYGKTVTPFKIPNINIVSHLRSIELNWDKQENLSNLKEYWLQVSTDKNNWFSLCSDGSNWRGTEEFSVIPGAYYIHANLLPSDTTYYYRVCQYTKLNEKGPWSDPVSSKLSLVDTHVIAENSIRANHIKAGEVTAEHLKADSIDAQQLSFLGLDNSPGVKKREHSILFPLSSDLFSTGGSSMTGNYEVIPDGRQWESEGEENFSEGAELDGVIKGKNYFKPGIEITVDPMEKDLEIYEIDPFKTYDKTLIGEMYD